jgi:hypothetical protein
MATIVDISMFNTDNLKLTLFFALINKSTVASNYMYLDSDLPAHDATLRSIKRGYIDYFNGRVFKSNISGDIFETGLYNRDNGNGAAERIVQHLREQLALL